MGGGEGLFRSQGYLGRRDHSDDEQGILGKERASGGGRVMERSNALSEFASGYLRKPAGALGQYLRLALGP